MIRLPSYLKDEPRARAIQKLYDLWQAKSTKLEVNIYSGLAMSKMRSQFCSNLQEKILWKFFEDQEPWIRPTGF